MMGESQENIYLTVGENLNFLKNFFGTGINLVESTHEISTNHILVGLAISIPLPIKKWLWSMF